MKQFPPFHDISDMWINDILRTPRMIKVFNLSFTVLCFSDGGIGRVDLHFRISLISILRCRVYSDGNLFLLKETLGLWFIELRMEGWMQIVMTASRTA